MNDKKAKLKNRLWMISSFIILFLVSYFLSWGANEWVLNNEGMKADIDPSSHLILLFISFLCASVILAIMYFLLLRPLDKIGVSMKNVAKGDFSIVLKHKSPIPELKSMRDNFNIMTHELSGMETLRNDFVVSVSHEFNTPLAAISGYAMLLQNSELSEQSRRECVEKIIANTKNLTDLTGNILRLSKLENQGILTETRFRLDEQIRRVLLLLEQKWEEKEIELDLELPKTECEGNAELLQIVWYNLISNAVKYSHKGGVVRIGIKQDENGTKVTVEDNGIGIGEEDVKHIFEKFYQADKSHSSGGNGLGLSLVKKIVELHGGKVDVDSKPGEGTIFTVLLKNKDDNE